MSHLVSNSDLDFWLQNAQAAVNVDYIKFAPNRPDMIPTLRLDKITDRTKYARIFVADDKRDQRSVWGFINLENGDILKADGWKKPALNFARGNMYDPNLGLVRVKWTGVS